jgi:predicted O-methyltransferase YrrM
MYVREVFRRIWLTSKWAMSVLVVFMLFMLRRPRSSPAFFKFILSRVNVLPERIRHEFHIDEEKARMAQCLTQLASVFPEVKKTSDICDKRWLKETRSLVDNKWGLLYFLVRMLIPEVVVETGVAEGQSTSHILQALADNGRGFLVSIDKPNQLYILDDGKLHAEISPLGEPPGCLIPSELRHRWRLVIGSSKDKLSPVLDSLGQVDLFLHDSEHTYATMLFEFESAWPYIRSGGYLVVDDAIWNQAFANFTAQRDLKSTIIGRQGFLLKP